MWTIWQRELRAWLLSPLGYAAAVVYLCLSGWVFVYMTRENLHTPQSLQTLLAVALAFWLPLLISVVTMRSFAEERQLGTLEMLLTAPVGDAAVVGGKFLGAYTFVMLVMVAGTAPLWFMLRMAGQVIGFDPAGLIVVGLLLLLMAASGTAIGVLCSLCTRHQAVAAVLTLLALLTPFLLYLALTMLRPDWIVHTGGGFPIEKHLLDAARCVLDLRVVLGHLSVVAACLFVCVRILEVRVWRA